MKLATITALIAFLFAAGTSFSQTAGLPPLVTVRMTLLPGQSAGMLDDLLPAGSWTVEAGSSVIVRTAHPEELRFFGCPYRIIGGPGPEPVVSRIPLSPSGAHNPLIQDIVDAVSVDSISGTIQTLQNFGTRYEYTPQQDSAGDYLFREFTRLGLDVGYDTFYIALSVTLYDSKFLNPDTVFAVGTGGILRTIDGTASWQRCYSSPGVEYYGIEVQPQSTAYCVGTGGKILLSTDAGTTWSVQPSGTTVALFDVGFSGAASGIAVGDSGAILRTTDGGSLWQPVLSGTAQRLRGLSVVDSLHAWAVGMNGTILRSTDGGASWAAQTPPGGLTQYLRHVDFVDASHGWIVGLGGTLLQTSDGGANWTALTAPAGSGSYLYGLSFIDTLRGWVVDNLGKVYLTTDGGATWTTVSTSDAHSAQLISMSAYDGQRLAACGTGGNLIISTDGGSTWMNQSSRFPGDMFHIAKNVVATLPGLVTPEQECIIVGHYDSYSPNPYVSAPGANDNATGTCAVLEAARLCRSYRFRSTIKFLAVTGEELGLYGSAHYASTASSQGRTIPGVVNGDMIGYPTTGDTTRLVVDCYQHYTPLLDSALVYNQRYGIGLTLVSVVDNAGGSDHVPFTQNGYNAIEVAEATANEIWGGADPYYHTVNDTYDRLSRGQIRRGVQLMIATVAELAQPFAQSVTLALDARWNIVSLPVAAEDSSLAGLFPGMAEGAYYYDSSYHQADTLRRGRGYWVKTAEADTFTITGDPVVPETIAVRAGWNLIGSASVPVAVASLMSDPPGIRTSLFFRYSNGYVTTDSVVPGRGYWVRTDQDGALILSQPGLRSLGRSIRIRDGGEVPPPPPSGDGRRVAGKVMPVEFVLEQNYPNPFNPSTMIRYALPAVSRIRLSIYNVLGQEVKILSEGIVAAGFRTAEWNTADVAGGVYFCRLDAVSIGDPAKAFSGVRRMLLIK